MDGCNFDVAMTGYDSEVEDVINNLSVLSDIESAPCATSDHNTFLCETRGSDNKASLGMVTLKMLADNDEEFDQEDGNVTSVFIKQEPSRHHPFGEADKCIPENHPSFMTSASNQSEYKKLQENAAFAKVREFLANQEFNRFVQILHCAIKRDSLQAVTIIIDILKIFGFDLAEPKFRENVYTASVLHVALLFRRDEICRLLIKNFPKLVTVKYDLEKFQNQTVFHIAASNNQSELLDLMLAAVDETTGVELLNTVANGSYFNDVHQGGALALTAAAYSGHTKMLRLLIERGADPKVRGSDGNTVLHSIVLLSAMFPNEEIPRQLYNVVEETCMCWWQRQNDYQASALDSEYKRQMAQVDALRQLLYIRNEADQNVLTLAVYVNSNLTMLILNTEHIYKLPLTKFGALSWSTYDVTEVVSFAPPGKTCNRYNPRSVLHVLAHRPSVSTDKNDQALDLIEEEPIKSVVRMKWDTYRWVYLLWCMGHFFYMICMSAIALHYYQPYLNVPSFDDSESNPTKQGNASRPTSPEEQDRTYRVVHIQYIFFILFPIGTMVLELLDFVTTGYSNVRSLNADAGRIPMKYGRYVANQMSATGNAPYRVGSFLFSVSTIVWLIMHFKGDDDQDIPLALAMIFGWLFMLMFTRGCRHVCQFSIMMQKMFFQDCLYFIAVYSIFWLAFTTAMHVLLFYGETPAPHVGMTLYQMLNIITDAGDKSSSDGARIPAAAAILLNIYAVLSVVLLLNMLIAMMNSSYESVTGSRSNVSRHQQLSILLLLERRFWWLRWLCKRSQCLTWSPKLKQKKGSTIPTRIYLEVTEKTNFAK